jgi:hypothetical protein
MKTVIFSAILAFSAAASAQISMDLPSLWWPEEFTGEKASSGMKAQVNIITDSKNIKAYLKQNNLGRITNITKVGKKLKVTTLVDGCEFEVVIRDGKALPVKNTLECGA